jgi:alpha-ketoglutarate-dependent taurine dioxygenase
MTLEIKPLNNVGVEVTGFDINAPISDETKEELKSLWYQHGILIFRNQDITAEKQIEFSRIFGPLELHPLKATTSDDYPELFVLENGGDKDFTKVRKLSVAWIGISTCITLADPTTAHYCVRLWSPKTMA